jgi:hypothetical protein
MSPSKKSPPKSIFSRSTKLLGLATHLAQKEIQGLIDSTQKAKLKIEQTKKMVEELGRLKGAEMKAGQMISQEIRDYLPEEARLILEKLQDSGEPAPFSDIESILKRELGHARFSQIQNLNTEPLASASIGQVHRAELPNLDGSRLSAVLKVQFDGISESIESDLEIFKKISKLMMTLANKGADLDPLFEELKTTLLAETDYPLELKNTLKYRSLLEGDPDLRQGVVIPEVIPEYTTQRVLALQYIHAMRFEDWLKSNPSQKQRQWIGEKLLEIHFKEFYFWGFVQTDPNFGNFLVIPSANEDELPKLVLLDFGSMKSFSDEFRKKYTHLLRAIHQRKNEEILSIVFELGLLSPKENEKTLELFLNLLTYALTPLHPEKQPFDFNNDEFAEQAKTNLIDFIKSLKHSSPPRDLIFLNRKLGGIYRLMRALKVKIDLGSYLDRLP